jgi:hypothetical protein
MSDKGPGIVQRAWNALLLLAAICLVGHLIQLWVMPLLPVVFAVLVLLTLLRLLFGRR